VIADPAKLSELLEAEAAVVAVVAHEKREVADGLKMGLNCNTIVKNEILSLPTCGTRNLFPSSESASGQTCDLSSSKCLQKKKIIISELSNSLIINHNHKVFCFRFRNMTIAHA
jgi:hypothetical protein